MFGLDQWGLQAQPLVRQAPRWELARLAALAAALAGCSGEPPLAAPTLVPPAGRSAPISSAPAAAAPPPASSGLTPLPSAEAVVGAVPVGRLDPFRPPSPIGAGGPAPAAAPQPPVLPEGFRFQGVLRSAGAAQALVELGAESGVLRVGDRGGHTTALLPRGWSVAAIDVERGRLLLRQGRHTIKVEL